MSLYIETGNASQIDLVLQDESQRTKTSVPMDFLDFFADPKGYALRAEIQRLHFLIKKELLE